MSAADPAIGREIGSYRIMEVLGQGGMGKVYRAQHPHIGKQVAIKLLRGDLSSQQPDAVQRFFQEARAVNDIHHENVIDILDFGATPDNEYYLLMEFLEGRTLSQALKDETPFPDKRVGHIGLQICSALQAAHQKGIIHRDLKSDNIFLITRSGQKDFVKVLDFGIAKLLDDPVHGAHTTTGMVLGTPLYMAPEQALGKPLDHQADIYALGVLLYQMATGTFPFFDANPVALATMHVTAKIPKPSSRFSRINPKLEKVILRCLEKDKANRYPSMTHVAADLALACGLVAAPYFGLDPNSGWQRALAASVPGAPGPTALLARRKRRGWYGVVLATLGVTVLVGALGFGVIYPEASAGAPPEKAEPVAARSISPEPASVPDSRPSTVAAPTLPDVPTEVVPPPASAPLPSKPLPSKPGKKPKNQVSSDKKTSDETVPRLGKNPMPFELPSK